MNPGQLVPALSCTKTHKIHVTLTFDLNIQYTFRTSQGTRSRKISSSYVQRFMSYRVNRKKNSDDAENNTAVASGDSNKVNCQLELAF